MQQKPKKLDCGREHLVMNACNHDKTHPEPLIETGTSDHTLAMSSEREEIDYTYQGSLKGEMLL